VTTTDVDAFADSFPLNASHEWGSGTPAFCRIRVPMLGLQQSAQFLNLALAHEVFHCFQF
jgi:hypothetical protein